jgi:hypothetical protein
MLRVLALTVALLLVGDVVALAVTGSDDPTHPAATPTSSTTATSAAEVPGSTAAPASPIQAVVPELEQFVERTRGLRFKQPVKVELLGDAAFVERLRGADERDVDALQKAEGFLRALHLIGGDVQLEHALDTLLASAVAGFYDPKTKALVVRGGEATPYVRSVLAHELTHALQDQHFDLDRPELDRRSDEASQAFTGLVEGDAVRIQLQYFLSLGPADRRSFAAEEQAQASETPKGVPEVLVKILVFPYQDGPSFVGAVLKAGGQARLDAAFAAPPETSEQLLHPAAFLRGDGPKPVAAPKADGKVSDEGVFGELGLLLILDDALGHSAAARASQGWGGDHYVAWRAGGKTCVRTAFVMDTPKDTSELDAALHTWAGRHTGATVEGTGPITLTSCG